MESTTKSSNDNCFPRKKNICVWLSNVEIEEKMMCDEFIAVTNDLITINLMKKDLIDGGITFKKLISIWPDTYTRLGLLKSRLQSFIKGRAYLEKTILLNCPLSIDISK